MKAITREAVASLDPGNVRDRLAHDLMTHRGVLLSGAGISKDPPTGLPLGGEVNEQFLRVVQDAARSAGPALKGLADEGEIGFVRSMLPERVISAFFGVFGYPVFRFLDGFVRQCPNGNHRGFAELAEAGVLTDVFTLNFDLALEQAWYDLSNIWPASATTYQASRQLQGRCVHKPHGTLSREVTGDLERKYQTLKFSLETVRSARDPELVQWLGRAATDRVLLVAGYSAGDIDVFPSLRIAARGCNQVYWCSYDPEADLFGTRNRALRRWLEEIDAEILPGRIASHLPDLLAACGRASLDPDRDDKCGPLQGFSLAHLAEDPPGVLLAAALLLHEANAPGQHSWIDPILKWLESARASRRGGACRHDILFTQLRAARLHEADERIEATRLYREVYRKLRMRRRKRGRDEQLAIEMTVDQAACRLCYQRLALLKVGITPVRAVGAAIALVRLTWIGPLSWRRKDRDARGLASHFLAEFFQQAAFFCDRAAKPTLVQRWLYRVALSIYRLATRRTAGWRPFQAFHELRRDEVWFLLNRGDPKLPAREEYEDWLDAMGHYEYLREVVGGDIGYQLVLLVQALHAVKVEHDERKGEARLRLASCIYAKREYPAGTRRTVAYRQLCGLDKSGS